MPSKSIRLFFIKWNVRDWLTDTARLSLAAQGLWARLLCLMLLEPERGVYERTIPEACRELGCSQEELNRLVEELVKFKKVSISKEIVRAMSGRMVRDETARESNAVYQLAHRRKTIVRGMSENSKGQKLEVRCYKHLTSNDKKEEKTAIATAPAQAQVSAPATPSGPTPKLNLEPTPTQFKHPNVQAVEKVFAKATPAARPKDPELDAATWEEGATFFASLKAKYARPMAAFAGAPPKATAQVGGQAKGPSPGAVHSSQCVCEECFASAVF